MMIEPRKCAATVFSFVFPALCMLTGARGLAQSSATVGDTSAEITAGETFAAKLTFDTAATCQQHITIPIGKAGGDYFYLEGNLQPGQSTVNVSVQFPKDAEGLYQTDARGLPSPDLYPCDGYRNHRKFTVPAIALTVKSIPDPNLYPTSASVSLTLTQKQFLGTKIAALGVLSTAVDTKLEANGNDTPELRAFLEGVVDKADRALSVTEHEYSGLLLKADEKVPSFFADFHKQYRDLRTELRAPAGTRAAQVSVSAHFMRVSQTTMRRHNALDAPAKSGNLSGTVPGNAKAVKSTLDDNASAYKIVQMTGRAVFHARFESTPSAATLYYRQAIDSEFGTWSKVTNIEDAEFPLATFVFKFHKDGCVDEPVRIVDPYYDTHPDLGIEFKRCDRK